MAGLDGIGNQVVTITLVKDETNQLKKIIVSTIHVKPCNKVYDICSFKHYLLSKLKNVFVFIKPS